MIDFSKAEKSKNHKSSFESAANAIVSSIEELLQKYNETWNELERNRKDRASLIDEIIHILKSNSVKTNMPLVKCNNDDLNRELNAVMSSLSLIPKETVQCNLIKINNRYEEIIRLGKMLENLTEELSKMRLIEKDYDEEVIIDFSKEKAKVVVDPIYVEKTEKIDEVVDDAFELEEVVKISKPTDELIESLNDDLKVKFSSETESIVDEIQNENELEDDEIASLDELIGKYLNDEKDESDEYLLYELKDGESFIDINTRVFDGDVPWENLLMYDDNNDVIEGYANRLNISVSDLVNSRHLLTGAMIKIPYEITYTQVDEDNEYSESLKVA